MLIAAAAGFLLADDTTNDVAAAATTSSTQPAPTTTAAPVTTTVPPSSSTTLPSTTTTVAPSTTSSTLPDETVAGFVDLFAAALASGDEPFVQGRLHPEVIDSFGEDLCRAWVTREIMALSQYQLVSEDGGPADRSFNFPGGSKTITDVFDATVSFVFEGQIFTNPTNFALVNSEMYWLGQCR